ncbi:hypothetical protein [Maritimibacter fusiformis]|uniref:Lipoprotein n=1 Tax=Maritimibacter fusiformis TaxID=2603819 RepID=A0A5D0R9P8_9RHOB|nr:hypothetical protein [Maritimibacter fusiformis]TYB77605.1 hypothetical protein FVF75_15185 [Maritimibacter fusiformis]
MIRLIAFVAALSLPLPGLALSCLPYSHTQAFLDANAAAERYIVVTGRLDFDSRDLPGTDGVNAAEDSTLSARVTGTSLSYAGFVTPFDRTIRVNVACAAMWCGQLDAGHHYLMFLRQGGGDWVLEQAPCTPMAFFEPTAQMEAEVVACMQGGPCAAVR